VDAALADSPHLLVHHPIRYSFMTREFGEHPESQTFWEIYETSYGDHSRRAVFRIQHDADGARHVKRWE
jgi:hypothetical protein